MAIEGQRVLMGVPATETRIIKPNTRLVFTDHGDKYIADYMRQLGLGKRLVKMFIGKDIITANSSFENQGLLQDVADFMEGEGINDFDLKVPPNAEAGKSEMPHLSENDYVRLWWRKD